MSKRTFVILVLVLIAGGVFFGLYRRGLIRVPNQQEPQSTPGISSLSGTVVSFTGETLKVRHDFANKFPGLTDIQTIIVKANTPTVSVDNTVNPVDRTASRASEIAAGDTVVIYARVQLPSPLEVTAENIDVLWF